MAPIPPWALVRKTIPQDNSNTTTVRMAVARWELTPSIPILANMLVSAANTADNNANSNHMEMHLRLWIPVDILIPPRAGPSLCMRLYSIYNDICPYSSYSPFGTTLVGA